MQTNGIKQAGCEQSKIGKCVHSFKINTTYIFINSIDDYFDIFECEKEYEDLYERESQEYFKDIFGTLFKDRHRNNLWHIACKIGRIKTLQKIPQEYIESTNFNGWTPLFF